MYIQPYLVFSPNPADPYIISKKDKERLAWQDGPPLKIWQNLTLLKKRAPKHLDLVLNPLPPPFGQCPYLS